MPEIDKVIDELVVMERAGAPIVTSQMLLRLVKNHFHEEKAPPEVMPIRTNGDVEHREHQAAERQGDLVQPQGH